ncbi:hypothetical protein DYE49_04690 [Treponema rectale]|uniref:Sugar-specific transcriptional regulator TrmB n=1 Tax=Treponema rectale TaxID=744512 RepID=A0A840SG55_9SPIR|nr:hypothetical protein [Treponema rectale]MBB5218523.1 sugar-specific transcriptional regulator TrmB [Treponema rectale]QOS39792.1 hypothetical protein DYE49_04690 [Treponema rectale]
MKKEKVFFCFVFLTLALFYSCSSPESQFDREKQTLRSTADEYDGKIEWTENLEEKDLSKPGQPEKMAANVKASVQSVILSSEKTETVYPCIEGFASLYLGNAEPECISIVRKFTENLINDSENISLMFSGREYELAVFLYNYRNILSDQKASEVILGNPFVSEDQVQFPVRVYLKSSITNYELKPHIDFFVYLSKSENEWKIIRFDFF